MISKIVYMVSLILRLSPKYVAATFFRTISRGIVSVVQLLFLQILIENITKNYSLNKVIIIIIVFSIFFLINSLMNLILEKRLIPEYLNNLSYLLKKSIYQKSMDIGFENYENPDFYNNYIFILNGLDNQCIKVIDDIMFFFSNFITTISVIYIIVSLDYTIIFLIILLVATSVFVNSKVFRYEYVASRERVQHNRIIGYINQIFTSWIYAKDLRIYNDFEHVLLTKLKIKKNDINGIIKRFSKNTTSLLGIQSVVSLGISTLIIIYLILKAIEGEISTADFLLLYNSSNMLSGLSLSLLSIIPNFFSNSLYIEKFYSFFNPGCSNNLNHPTVYKENKIKSVKIVDLNFSYPNKKEQLLNNIVLNINEGEKIAIIGENGSGKSTLVKLLCGLYKPKKGFIYYNDISQNHLNQFTLSNSINAIFQDRQIYAISIAENIVMKTVDISNSGEINKIINALDAVGLKDKVLNLKDGIFTILTKEFFEDGEMFSGGELQRIALARIFASDKEIIIIDEPSNHLDNHIGKKIMQNLIEFCVGKILIVVSHNQHDLEYVDKIYELKNGNLFEKISWEGYNSK